METLCLGTNNEITSDLSEVLTTLERVGCVIDSSHDALNSMSTSSCSRNVFHIVSHVSKLDNELRLMIAKEKQTAFYERIKHDALLNVVGGWEQEPLSNIT